MNFDSISSFISNLLIFLQLNSFVIISLQIFGMSVSSHIQLSFLSSLFLVASLPFLLTFSYVSGKASSQKGILFLT